LIGCTMAPGFVGSAYEGGVRAELLTTYPAAAELITRLTRPGMELGTPPES
jgi:predicted cupin superfamily sugar epimerase